VIGRGRAAGDAVLRAIARLLLASLRRKVDVACVHGAGEFALLLPSTPPFRPGAALVAQRLREAVSGMELRDEDHGLLGAFTLSVGVAGFPRHAEDADELGGCAVEALAKARALGGDRVQIYGEAPDAFMGDGTAADEATSPDDPLSRIILPPDWDDAPDAG
jgi:diguanylate cyclase (GGDEF)-like protein